LEWMWRGSMNAWYYNTSVFKKDNSTNVTKRKYFMPISWVAAQLAASQEGLSPWRKYL
jgi:hypothetical protein